MSFSNLRGMGSAIVEHGRSQADSVFINDADSQGLVALTEVLLSGRGEASGAALARGVLDEFRELDENYKVIYFQALAERFGSDHLCITEAARRYLEDLSNVHAMFLHEAAEPRSGAEWNGRPDRHARTGDRTPDDPPRTRRSGP